MLSLDQDSLLAIVERLPLQQRFRLESTCRTLAAIVRHPSLWRKVSFVQLVARGTMAESLWRDKGVWGPAAVQKMYATHTFFGYSVAKALNRFTDAHLRALLVRMNCVQHIEELWLDGCEAVRGSALEVLRGAPKLRCISLFTRADSALEYPTDFMDASVVGVVKSLPALQIAHIPQQRVGSGNPQRAPYEERDEPWRGLTRYVDRKRREDKAPCGFCSCSISADPAYCSECGKRSCKDQSKGCPKTTGPCDGCRRRFCVECKVEHKAETKKAAMAKCCDCKRKFCFVCRAKDFSPCTNDYCRRNTCEDCTVRCESCDEPHCAECAEEEFVDGMCDDCWGEQSDSGEWGDW